MVAKSVKPSTDKVETPSNAEVEVDRPVDINVSTDVSMDSAPDVPDATPVFTAPPEPDAPMEPDLDQAPPFEPIQNNPPTRDQSQSSSDPHQPRNATLPEITVRRVGFGPVILGGIVAAALGYAAAYFGQLDQSADSIALLAAQSDRISALEAQLTALPAPPDLSPLTTAISDMQAGLAVGQTETATALVGMATRLDALELAPNSDGTLPATAIFAWRRELVELRHQIAQQQAQFQALSEMTTNQLSSVRANAATIEADARDAAGYVLARAALSRIQAALDAGTTFDTALAEFVQTAPVRNATPGADALRAIAADGVPTLTALQLDFPNAARAALAVARSEGLAGEEGGGITAFLRNQFDVRSVIPLEGTTADAILSRAEEDLRQNRLSDALAEVATLPEVVRAEMARWTSAAETRTAALAAVESLSEILTQN